LQRLSAEEVAMTRNDEDMDQEEFERLLGCHRTLSPEQHEVLVRRAIARAKAYRAETIRALFRRLAGWMRRRTAIARLQSLDDRMLKDMGLYRSEIEAAVRGEEPSQRRVGRAA
jgi:uncharacterized protein YjiS (DUF1127 family)